MSYSGDYTRVSWENYPSVATPIDEINLNNMDATIKKHDETLESWDGAGGKADKSALAETNTVVATKADQTTVNGTFNDISFNSTTGVFTFTKVNGTTVTINTALEKVVTNFYYDDDPTSAHYQSLVLTLEDGSTQYVDMSAMITQYEFTNSSTISFTVGNDGSVSASVINGSITGDKLEPNYLANVTAQATAASGSASDAEAWAKGTRNGTAVSSDDATYHNNSKYYSEQADGSSEDSEAWAVGQRNGVDVPSTDPTYHNNAKYYSQQVDNKMDKANPTGTGSFSLNRKANTTVGDYSFAEGSNTTASGNYSHAEGSGPTASGDYSHAEGLNTRASGQGSHAEGWATTASGDYSHAAGIYNIAGYSRQTVVGKYNSNKSTTLFEVGNGTSTSVDKRSNAFEVYSDGSLSGNNGTTKTKLPVIKSGTLTSGNTSVSISDMPSTGNNLIKFYTSVPGLNYTGISVSGTTVTLTYPAQSSDVTVYAMITEVTS